jgi:hypothetical protein
LAIEGHTNAVDFNPHIHSLDVHLDQPYSQSGGYVAAGDGYSPLPFVVCVDVAVARKHYWIGGRRCVFLWMFGAKYELRLLETGGWKEHFGT